MDIQNEATTGARAGRVAGLWSRNAWPTLRLAAPIMISRAGITLLFVVDTIMVGQTKGIELAFLGQALAIQSILMLASIGLLQSSMILTSQAFGAGDYLECGRTLKAAIVAAALVGAAAALLSLGVESILRLLGIDDDLARGAGLVSLQMAWGMPGMLLYIASNYFLESIKKPYFGLAIMAVCNVLNLALDGVLVAGWLGGPSGDAVTAIATTSAVRWLAFALALTAVLRFTDTAKYGLWQASGPVLPRLKKMGRLGAPIAVLLGADQAAFSTMILMAGLMGTLTAAAQQLTTNLTGIVFMLIVGLSAATNIRVGHAVGAGDRLEAARAGWTGIVLAAGITGLVAILFQIVPQQLASLYTSDQPVIAAASGLIMAAALTLVFDASATVTNGALRGRGDTMTPALIHVSALWLVGVPAAWLVAFPLGGGAPGLFVGLAVGICLSCLLLAVRFHKLSLRPVQRT
ncbi:MAG TPA: hypothetical protein DCL54_06830 [Alphaproteobacteria bacterium]|nr:hypothetical protein [Alphaproteobacteria bacterium]HAJ46277.1 hypothetical protein [Alphaproteobacteria bacterium]